VSDSPLPALSVVAPVYNEAAVLAELARRCASAAAAAPSFEVLLVDDASSDDTRAVAATLTEPGVRVLHLERNRGQRGATQHGLGAARGHIVVLLDGDLQDPPEQIPALYRELLARDDLQLVFAQKTSRQDPLWFRLGRLGFRAIQRLGRVQVPSGVGSYCAMRAPLAQRAARVRLPAANMASLLVALQPPFGCIPYAKQARYDGQSRVGLAGLVREALGSLALTGALGRAGLGAGLAMLACGAALGGAWPVFAAVPATLAAGLSLSASARASAALHASRRT
jgi:hypothetical protein